jgi:hypothetical protein
MKAAEERTLALRTRLQGHSAARQLNVPWRTHSLVAQLVFFILTCVGVASFYGLAHVASMPLKGVVTGVAAIVVAEYLIRLRRWFFTGVEAALWISALIAAISDLPSSGEPEALLVFAAAFAIAGARVRNPLFGAVAAAFVANYAEARFDLGVIAAVVIAMLALIALLRTWQRPSTEWLFILIALALPIAGWFNADEVWRNVTIILYMMFAVIAFALGIARRHHAFFFAAMIATAIAAIDLGRAVALAVPLEAKLAFAGVIVLAATFAISRTLRDRKHGLVTTPRKESDESLLLLTALAPQPTAEPAPESLKPGEGQFGGAGASGSY